MSKVSEAKLASGYQEKPILPVCSNCVAFKSDRVLPEWMVAENTKREPGRRYTVQEYGLEKNLRCSDYGFAVKKMAGCQNFRAK